MNPFRNLGLLGKINLTAAVILLLFFVLSSILYYRQQRAFAIAEGVEKARIIAYEAIRTREYLSEQLLLTGIELSEERYGMIPVVASNRIGERVGRDLGYRVRQVSDRYRNPRNAPDAYEAEVLQSFYANPHRQEAFGITRLDGERVFRYLQAFNVEQSCLECHGDPRTAPGYIKRLFPEAQDQAYNYRIGEVIGAASVTIPMARLDAQVYAQMRNQLIGSAGILLALFISLGLLIRAAVSRPLAQLGAATRAITETGRFDQKIPPRGRDEIGTLILGFNAMIDQLRENTAHLEESERRFRLLAETARDGIISFLSNGQIILFNRQAERIFGYGKREVIGETLDRLIHESFAELHQTGIEAYLRREGDELMRSVQRLPGRRRDGSLVPLEWSLSAAESDGHLFYTAIVREGAPEA